MIKQVGRGLCLLGAVLLVVGFILALPLQIILWVEIEGYIWFKVIAFIVWLIPLAYCLGEETKEEDCGW